MQSPFLSPAHPSVRSLHTGCRRPRPGCAALAIATLLVGVGCASSEAVAPRLDGGGTGGVQSTGSGGTTTPGGSGGASNGSGGNGENVNPGTGGGTGSGGARIDAGNDSGPADVPVDGGGALTYSKDIAYELFFSCGGCHLPPTVKGNFDMKILKSDAIGPDAYPTIMGTVTPAHAGCASLDATKKRIVPMKPDNSLLFIKISVAKPPNGCGNHMPDGASITPGQIAKIKLWIEQGALP